MSRANDLSARLKDLVHDTGLRIPRFAEAIGTKPQRLYEIMNGRTKTVSYALGIAIERTYPEYDIEWLRTGKGNMLKPSQAPAVTAGGDVVGENKVVGDGNRIEHTWFRCCSPEDTSNELELLAREVRRLHSENEALLENIRYMNDQNQTLTNIIKKLVGVG